MNTRAAGRGTTTAGIAVTTDAVTTVAAAGERGRQGTRRGVIYQPGYTLTKSATFPENRTTSVSRLLTGSSTVPFHRGGRCFVRLPVSRSLTGSSTVPVHREGGSRQRMSGPSTMSHPALWTCPACGRPLTVALNPEGGEAGAHRPLEISRASAAAHACTPAARFPQFHSASSSSSITGYEPASCQPWQPPVSAGAEDDEGVISQSEYTLTKPSSCPNHRDHVKSPTKFRTRHRPAPPQAVHWCTKSWRSTDSDERPCGRVAAPPRDTKTTASRVADCADTPWIKTWGTLRRGGSTRRADVLVLRYGGGSVAVWRWCRGPESNWRHHDFQSCALPTELPRPVVGFDAFGSYQCTARRAVRASDAAIVAVVESDLAE